MIRFRLFLAGKGIASLRGREQRRRLTRGRGGGCSQEVQVPANGEAEGPRRSPSHWRRGRTISSRPRRQHRSASRTPPAIVRAHVATTLLPAHTCLDPVSRGQAPE